jgi:hypothetical protein
MNIDHCPIDRLPDELLLHIFTAGCQPELENNTSFGIGNDAFSNTNFIRATRAAKPFIAPILCVCRRWAQLTSSTPHFYIATITLICTSDAGLVLRHAPDISTQLAIAKDILENSQGCDLDARLFVFLGGFTSTTAFRLWYWGISIMTPYLRQLRYVEVWCPPSEEMEFLFDLVANAENLSGLLIRTRGFLESESPDIATDTAMKSELYWARRGVEELKNHVPTLSPAFIDAPLTFMKKLPSKWLRSCRNLVLQNFLEDCDVNLQAISWATSLKDARINLASSSITPKLQMSSDGHISKLGREVSLTTLISLDLQVVGAHLVGAFLRSINQLPVLREMKIYLKGAREHLSEYAFRPRFPSLIQLWIENITIPELQIVALFDDAPVLERCTLEFAGNFDSGDDGIATIPPGLRFPRAREVLLLRMRPLQGLRTLLKAIQHPGLEKLVYDSFRSYSADTEPLDPPPPEHSHVVVDDDAVEFRDVKNLGLHIRGDMTHKSLEAFFTMSALDSLDLTDTDLTKYSYGFDKCRELLAKVKVLSITLPAWPPKATEHPLLPFKNVRSLTVVLRSPDWNVSTLSWLKLNGGEDDVVPMPRISLLEITVEMQDGLEGSLESMLFRLRGELDTVVHSRLESSQAIEDVRVASIPYLTAVRQPTVTKTLLMKLDEGKRSMLMV